MWSERKSLVSADKEPRNANGTPGDSESVSFEFSTVDKVDINDAELETVIDSLSETKLLTLTLTQFSQIGDEDLTPTALELAEYFGDVIIEYPIPENNLADEDKLSQIAATSNAMYLLLVEAISTITADTIMSTFNTLEDQLNPLWGKLVGLLAKEFNLAHSAQRTALGDRIRVAMEHPQYNPPTED
jgi:hypothetical protein